MNMPTPKITADTAKSLIKQILARSIELRILIRAVVFKTFDKSNETSKLIEMEKTIPSTVNSVCNTFTSPFSPHADATKERPTASTMRNNRL
jgi:hypothetical protein